MSSKESTAARAPGKRALLETVLRRRQQAAATAIPRRLKPRPTPHSETSLIPVDIGFSRFGVALELHVEPDPRPRTRRRQQAYDHQPPRRERQ